jgi:RNA polymerase sigma-70 factor (ECF subfamily)
VELHAAIAKLPARLRAVLVLRQIDGYSHDEVARLLTISPMAARARFSRAVKALRRLLTAET